MTDANAEAKPEPTPHPTEPRPEMEGRSAAEVWIEEAQIVQVTE
jgi:hypothetical protein